MNELLEKIKGLDKRILIGVGIAVAVVIILIIALVIGGSKPSNDKNTENGTDGGNLIGSENLGTENVTGTEVLDTELGTEMSTELEGTETEGEDGAEIGNTGGQEILGAGSASQPYEVIPDLSTMTVTTVTVPANSKLYYNIQRVGGMWLAINDADAYVIEADGTRHDAKNGKVGFTVENAMANEYVSLQIGNNSSVAKNFTIKFSNVKGSYQNPEKITTAGQYSTHLSAGNEVGYYYKYVAEKKGTIRFYIVSESTKCGINVTNNRNSANRTFQADVQEDAKGRYVELSADFVEAGDQIMIVVYAEKYRGSIPAADVTWEIVYSE